MSILLMTTMLLASLSPLDCSLGAGFQGPAPGESIALATATGRTVSVPVPTGGAFPPLPAAQVRAYEIVVFMATNPEPDRIDTWGLFAPGDTILAVPWSVDAACQPVLFEDVAWIPADSLVVVRADAARVHEGRRVVDVTGPFNGYPYITYPPADLQIPTDRATWIPAMEYFSLISGAPKPESDIPRETQLRRLDSAYRTGPTYLLERFPGPQMLSAARAWAAEANGR